MPAVFTGKLFAMLGSSIVGVAVWGFTAAIGFVMLSDKGLVALPAPEIGWPAFLILGILYFATNYLLVGALLLGIGAQASSVRSEEHTSELQSLMRNSYAVFCLKKKTTQKITSYQLIHYTNQPVTIPVN